MKHRLILFFILFYLAFFPSVYAKKADDFIIKKIESVNNVAMSDYQEAVNRLDSIEMFLTMEQSENFQPYLNLSYALLAYKKANYVRSLRLTDEALESFLYMENKEWVARCLINIGNIAEITRLIPEAVNAFTMALDYSVDPHTVGSAHLGLARNKRRMKREWKQDLQEGVDIYKSLGDNELQLYAQMVIYWFYQDSSDMTVVLPEIAKEYNEIGRHYMEADAYKCLVFHYDRINKMDSALLFVDKCIAANREEYPIAYSFLASAHHLKGKLLLKQDKYDEAMEEFNVAIGFYKDLLLRGNNYLLYQYLYDYEMAQGNYKKASEYSKELVFCFKAYSNMRVERYEQMSKLFTKITFITNELENMKVHSRYITLIVALFVALVFMILLWWMRSQKLHYKRKSFDMEVSNVRLREETGALLKKTKHNIFTNELSKTMSDFERKAERYLEENKDLPQILKDKYAETFLLCGARFPELSESEKRYAVMFVLDIKTKTIAELFNVQNATVAQYRNRIRKKLYISNTDIRLEEFLKQQIL